MHMLRSSAEILQEITELSHDIPTITETATQFSVSTETQLESLSNLDHHFKTESTINPNLYTPARWRWVWSIDKVLASLRVQKVINKIWRSANKGHLVYQTMTLDEQKRMLTNGRFPLFQSFRKYSTTISARQPQSAHMQTPVIIQPPPSIFHELISSFEDSKNKAKERRKSRILSPLHASNCSKNI